MNAMPPPSSAGHAYVAHNLRVAPKPTYFGSTTAIRGCTVQRKTLYVRRDLGINSTAKDTDVYSIRAQSVVDIEAKTKCNTT